MFHIGIDISKFKHDCFIATESGVKVKAFTFNNSYEGFTTLQEELKHLGDHNQIKIGFESTGHYGINLKSYLSHLGYTYIEFNPQLTSKFSQATTLRRTKTDKIDAKLIASMLSQFDYKTYHTSFYHINELKELVRARDAYMESRSQELVKLTNVLDKAFPEFKPFFNNKFGTTALYILKRFKNKERIANLNQSHYESLKTLSRGKLTYPKFSKLKHLAKTSIGVSNNVYSGLITISLDTYIYLSQLIKNLDKQIIDLYQQSQSLISTLPSISPITAATIYAEIGDINHFSNAGKMMAYAGIDVRISQSGNKEHFGKIVKRGSSLLRKHLFLYAFQSLRFIPEFHDYYHKKKSQGKHHKVVLIHIARKLLRVIYHLEKYKIPFDPNKIS